MRIVRPSSFDEYVNWYLRREATKRKLPPTIHTTIATKRKEMEEKHGKGKLRKWFELGRWHIVELETPNEEIENLVCLDSQWTRDCKLLNPNGTLDYRLLKVLVKNAKETNYFDLAAHSEWKDNREYQKHLQYLKDFRDGDLILKEENRIVLCSLDNNERSKNPSGTYYLHDGIGRLVPYLYTILNEAKPFVPVEAFVVEEC